MITSDNALIYTYILCLIGKRDFGLDSKTLRGVIARWFFMAHTTGRYTGSTETQIEADFARIGGLEGGDGKAFCDELDRVVRASFTDDYWKITLPNLLDTSAARSPSLYAYWAALHLLDAELLFSDLRISEALDSAGNTPRSIERRHLFSKSYLAAKGITGTRKVNAIANMAYMDWPEKATVSADGGTLLIGVEDGGNVLGLANDMLTLGAKGNLDVCVVEVAAAGRPVFSKPHTGKSGPTEFWVRVGNATKQLHGNDLVDYQADRWG